MQNNGCPKNITTGLPIINGPYKCPLETKRVLKWHVNEWVGLERRVCIECLSRFAYETEEIQLPAKTDFRKLRKL